MKATRISVWGGCAALGAAVLLLTQTVTAGGKAPKADIMFVLDITGSMQFAIDGVEDGLEKILKKLQNKDINAQVGLTVFRDEDRRTPNDKVAGITDDPFLFTFASGKNFTNDAKEYRKVVSKIKAEGGGDVPENSLEAVKYAAAKAEGRKTATRIMVLITDAPPHPGSSLNGRIANARNALAAHKYDHVYLITTKDQQATYEKLWNKKVGVSGAWFQISNQKAAFAGLLEAIADQMIADIQKIKK